jgi:pimeloyl-ACP methyl ester carboxylesterase
VRTALLVFALLCAVTPSLTAQKVVQVRWESRHTAPPVKLSGSSDEWLPAFRMALLTLPEAAIVALCLSQPQMLGLPEKDAEKLQRLTTQRYKLISADPVFQRVPTALPYCYSESKPSQGLATVYLPKNVEHDAQSIVFLHGYGGSFLWYLHLLVEAFPEAIIVCLAYGVSSDGLPAAYVREAVGEAAKVAGISLKTPVLVGLSAGGFGACKVYVDSPKEWRRLICLAAYAPDTTLNRYAKGMDVRFLAGSEEPFVANGYFQRGVKMAESRGAVVYSRLVPDCGHFFLLEKREESLAVLKEWMK